MSVVANPVTATPSAIATVVTPSDPLEKYPALMTKLQVSEATGFDPRTIERWSSEGIMPRGFHPGGGKSIRWRKSDIAQWIADGMPRVRRAPRKKRAG
jgi:predicted DNA-binding transcriptional regulator AlpA